MSKELNYIMSAQKLHSVWLSNRGRLSEFAITNLINRPDKTVINDGRGWRVPPGGSTEEHIRQVYARHHANALYTTSKDGLCRWVGVDIDNHNDSPEAAEVNLQKGVATLNLWTERGILAVLEDSDGQGGLHLWVIFETPIPVAEAYRFIRWATTHLGADDKNPERFPKQATAEGNGNALRIPGKHHKRDHFSRFWGDGEWLAGQEGIDLWPNAPLNSPAVLEQMGDYDPKPKPRAVKPKWEKHHPRPAGGTVADKAQALMQRLYTWETLLPQYGWTPGRREGDWLHPNASSLCSASIHEESGMLYVFSSNAGLPHAHGGTEKPIYSMWRFWVFMNGFDDSRQRDAAKEFLRRAGR